MKSVRFVLFLRTCSNTIQNYMKEKNREIRIIRHEIFSYLSLSHAYKESSFLFINAESFAIVSAILFILLSNFSIDAKSIFSIKIRFLLNFSTFKVKNILYLFNLHILLKYRFQKQITHLITHLFQNISSFSSFSIF